MKDWLKKNRYYLYCLYLPIYLIVFFLTERIIDGSSPYWSSYVPFDDAIPFVDWFVIFYCVWYVLLIGLGLWLLVKDKPAFERFMFMVMIGFSLSFVVFFAFPNGQDLRVADTGDTIFSKVVDAIYSADTNTNVLPSIHAYAGLLALVAVIDTKSIRQVWLKVLLCVVSVLTAISTVFVKQHSILDVYAAIFMLIPLVLLVYWRRFFARKKIQISDPLAGQPLGQVETTMGVGAEISESVDSVLKGTSSEKQENVVAETIAESDAEFGAESGLAEEQTGIQQGGQNLEERTKTE